MQTESKKFQVVSRVSGVVHTAHWSDEAIASATSAAKKCGVSLDGLQIKYATLDQTWGDKVGFVVIGGEEATRTRVASYLVKWLQKNLTKKLERSYDQQISVDSSPRQVAWLLQESAGRVGADGIFPKNPPSYYSEEDKADYLDRIRPALGIGCVYYPCSE